MHFKTLATTLFTTETQNLFTLFEGNHSLSFLKDMDLLVILLVINKTNPFQHIDNRLVLKLFGSCVSSLVIDKPVSVQFLSVLIPKDVEGTVGFLNQLSQAFKLF